MGLQNTLLVALSALRGGGGLVPGLHLVSPRADKLSTFSVQNTLSVCTLALSECTNRIC